MASLHSAHAARPPSTSARPTSTLRLRTRRRRVLALAVLPLLVAPTLAAAAAAGGAAAGASVGAGAAAPAASAVDILGPSAAVDVLGPDVTPGAAAAAAAAAVAAGAAAAGAGAGAGAGTDAGTSAGAAGPPATGGEPKTEGAALVVPFDGKDGRPHEGPFVEIDNGRKAGDTQKTSVYIDGKKVPESNDGVMDDKNRAAPKDGTTGMSGGVSEKDKVRKAKEGQTGERVENTPETPKEVPALPHHEEEKILGTTKDSKGDKAKDASTGESAKIGKPADLPDMTHDSALPVPESANKDHLDVSKPVKATKPTTDKSKTPARPSGSDEETSTLIQPFHSFILSLTMILVSEVGDKTFLVAALMAMKHDRVVVFTAAFSALFAMTVLSAVLGHAVPVLIPKRLTNFLAAALFVVFGTKMLREGMAMGPDEGVAAEMQEVELELAEKEHQARENGRRHSRAAGGGVLSPDALEMGIGGGAGGAGAGAGGRLPRSQSRFSTPARSASSSLSPPRARNGWGAFDGGNGGLVSTVKGFGNGLSNLASLLLSPAWVQTFVMTFLGEWGDRSQIATLAMAAGQDYWWVTLGAITGHACCTSVAVIGGRAIAGRVSMKVVTVGGAVSFLLFGLIYLVEAFYAA